MNLFFLLFFRLYIFITEMGHVLACARTSTTTPPALTCRSCSLAQLQLTPGTITPTVSGIMTNANGCSSIIVTCTALTPTGLTFMQFNTNEGGPLQPSGNIVNAQLDCSANGVWTYNPPGLPSRVISEVNCVST